MAKLRFRYATMKSGKSAEILQINFNYEMQNFKGMLLIPEIDSASNGQIKSRLGISSPAHIIKKDTNIYDYIVQAIKTQPVDYVIVDECNFLTKEQCDQLGDIVDYLGINVMAYGILTNFKTELFEGSKRLVEIADCVENIYVRSVCHCGRTAVFNARIKNGKWDDDGEEIIIDTNKDVSSASAKKDTIEYIPLCRKCYKLKKIK